MFIEEFHAEHSVEVMCRVLGVSPSGHYAWLRRPMGSRECANRDLLELIRKFHRESRETYGSPRVVQDLHAIGIRCGKNRVARLMRRNGIAAKTTRRFRVTAHARKGAQYAPDRLQRNFFTEKPNRGGMDVGHQCAAATWRAASYELTNRVKSCMRDGGRPSGIGLQGQISNHLERHRSKALVVSVRGKDALNASGKDREGEHP